MQMWNTYLIQKTDIWNSYLIKEADVERLPDSGGRCGTAT
jgi:hypothetical protein